MLTIARSRQYCLLASTVALASLESFPAAHANEDLLSGLWMETANFPESSIIRFERDGDQIIGKYRQVSTPQRHWGFEVGETVIRGTVRGKVYQGQVWQLYGLEKIRVQ